MPDLAMVCVCVCVHVCAYMLWWFWVITFWHHLLFPQNLRALIRSLQSVPPGHPWTPPPLYPLVRVGVWSLLHSTFLQSVCAGTLITTDRAQSMLLVQQPMISWCNPRLDLCVLAMATVALVCLFSCVWQDGLASDPGSCHRYHSSSVQGGWHTGGGRGRVGLVKGGVVWEYWTEMLYVYCPYTALWYDMLCILLCRT